MNVGWNWTQAGSPREIGALKNYCTSEHVFTLFHSMPKCEKVYSSVTLCSRFRRAFSKTEFPNG